MEFSKHNDFDARKNLAFVNRVLYTILKFSPETKKEDTKSVLTKRLEFHFRIANYKLQYLEYQTVNTPMQGTEFTFFDTRVFRKIKMFDLDLARRNEACSYG